MPPAFSTSRQAAVFAALVALGLFLPALLGRAGWTNRRDAYTSIALKEGPFPFIRQQIFDERGDVDMAFVGSSHMWTAIDPLYVRRELSRALGRDATVFTVAWPYAGFDAVYFVARDLLEHRRVRELVVYDEAILADGGHPRVSSLFRVGENADAAIGLSLPVKASLYGAAVLGAPRHLLSVARGNLIEDPLAAPPDALTNLYRAPNVASRGGALVARLQFNDFYSPFEPYVPRDGTASPGDAAIYSNDAHATFEFAAGRPAPYQDHFFEKLAALCKERGTRLVVLHLPSVTERDSLVVRERKDWRAEFGPHVDMVGIPTGKLLAGLPKGDEFKLFYENGHLNENGQAYFTPLVTPALIELYGKPITHGQ